MKSILIILLIAISVLRISAQSQAETFIKEAQAYLAQKDYKQAQLSLQDAINDLNNILAVQVAEAMPDEINGLNSTGDDNINTGSMGMMGGGMQITKSYSNESKRENQAEVVILGNSPMMATMNMYMNNPGMLGQGYKSIRIGTRRAIMKTEMEDYYDDNGASKKIRSSEIQIPLTQSLITIQTKGFATEQDEIAFATKLDVEKLRTILGE